MLMPKRVCLGDGGARARYHWPQVSSLQVMLTLAVVVELQLWNRTLTARSHWAPVSSLRVMPTLAAAVELQRHPAHHRASQHERVTCLQPMPMMVCLGGARKVFHNQLVQRYLPLQQSGVAELTLQHMMGLAMVKLLTMSCLGGAQMHADQDHWEQASR